MPADPFVIVETIYPGMTQLDFTGPHTIFSRIPSASVIVASAAGGPVESDGGLVFAGTRRMAELERCDLLFVPGGMAATDVIHDDAFMREFRRLAAGARYLDLGLHRLDRARRGGAAQGQAGRLPLGVARHASAVRRNRRRVPRGARRKRHHRRRRHRGRRFRAGGRRRNRRRDACAGAATRR